MSLVTESTESLERARGLETISSLSDSDLLDAWVRDRQPAALGALVERYSVMVLSVCRRRCRTETDAEDAFQSTFLYLARNGNKIRCPDRLPGWLHRVAQRAAVATVKSAIRESEPMVEPPAKPDDPLDRLTQRHEAIVLDEELADLPEHYRSAIVMHLYEGLTIQSLAEHFETTVGSIRGRLQRGRQLLAQRLRRRGVVPILSFAAANAWTVSKSQAAVASEIVINATAGGDLPDPPVDTPLLESLLAQGVRLMPSLYTALGLFGGTALVALLVMTSGTQGQTVSDNAELSFSAGEVTQLGVGGLGETVTMTSTGEAKKKSKAKRSGKKDDLNGASDPVVVGGFGMGGFSGVPVPGQLVWTEEAVVPPPTSDLAMTVIDRLSGEIGVPVSTTLAELPTALGKSLGIPILLDDRGVAFAEQKGDAEITFDDESAPLQTALRHMLHPFGLKAVVEDEGLVITADPAALVHRGIGTSRWINVDQDAEQKIAAALSSESSAEFIELPLNEAIDQIGQQHDLQILIDRRALEEIGLSSEEPVTMSVAKIKLSSILALALRELDLTYTMHRESLVVTTIEAAEQELLNRIYWLEGTGYAGGDYEPIMESIQSTIRPDAWEMQGGASTMVPVGSRRPALLIRTTYTIHEEVDEFFQTLRETHFGRDPVLESVQKPLPQAGAMGGGGMGGGGFM